MQTVQLNTLKREKTGKSENHKLKQKSLIPAVIYGGEKNINISVPYNDFNKFYVKFKHSNVFYELNMEGDSRKIQTLVKEVLVHPVDNKVRHIDFYELREDKKLRTNVPVEIQGTAVGVKEGGVLEFFVRELTIESFPKDIPDNIIIDVSDLNINDSISVKDIKVKDSVRIIDDKDEVVVIVGLPQKEEVAATPEAAAVPGAEGTAATATAAAPVAGAKGATPVATPTAGAKGATSAAGGDKKPAK